MELVESCHDISEGGLAVSAAEMAFAGGFGIELDLAKVPNKEICRNDFLLFSESNSRFLVEVSKKNKEKFDAIMKGNICSEIGKITKKTDLSIKGLQGELIINITLENLQEKWKETLSMEV